MVQQIQNRFAPLSPLKIDSAHLHLPTCRLVTPPCAPIWFGVIRDLPQTGTVPFHDVQVSLVIVAQGVENNVLPIR